MNALRQVMGIMIGLALTLLIAGCGILPPPPTVIDITQDYSQSYKISQAEAVQILSGQYGMHDAHATVRLGAVNQTEMDIQEIVDNSGPPGQINAPGVVADVVPNPNHTAHGPYLAEEYHVNFSTGHWAPKGYIAFADIEHIRLSAFPARFHCCSILLCGKEPLVKGDHNAKPGQNTCVEIRCDWKPEVYNKLLSAFLALCPNVK